MQKPVDVSIIIPLLNEELSLIPLNNWIFKVFKLHSFSFELIFIDDGSTDKSWEIIKKLSFEYKSVRGIRFGKNFGKSQALNAGFKIAIGKYVATLDADLQDSPEEIPELIKNLNEGGYDLISGWKKKRFDSVIFKNIPSKLFNWAARMVSGIKLNDFNCGIKVYRNEVIKNIDVYGEMHRYIPLLAAQKGFDKIGEKIVQHQARKFGHTKFGTDRFFKGFLDLITLWFINKFGKRPMYFFGLWGSLMLFFGFSFTLYLGIDKLFFDMRARLITSRPEFYIALTLMILGSQFFIAGFLGEIILRSKENKKRYIIKEETTNR
tara:strand:+ start:23221 stop:24183 length:963 start_codon:yes stop_codon:yes gene_type:complete